MANTRKKSPYPVLAVLGVAAAVLLATRMWRSAPTQYPPPLAFSGDSAGLQRTLVVPHLQTPREPGKSLLWCSGLQIAWNRLKEDVVKEPIRLAGAQELADRLNRGKQSEVDLASRDFCAVAGFFKDGVLDRLKQAMAERFPAAELPEMTPSANGGMAYCHLEAVVPFSLPFFDYVKPTVFTDSAGGKTEIRSLGIRQQDADKYLELRKQVKVLFTDGVEQFRQFIVDPCVTSTPYQVVLACIKPGKSLADMVDFCEQASQLPNPAPKGGTFDMPDSLMVPTLHWRIQHRFADLKGKEFLNTALKGLHLSCVEQVMHFRLDRGGVALASRTKLEAKSGPPRCFHFDHPFLIYLKLRDGGQPFLALWVDNAELLSK